MFTNITTNFRITFMKLYLIFSFLVFSFVTMGQDGCMDDTACNFEFTAVTDDGSCLYVGDICDSSNPLGLIGIYADECECILHAQGDYDANRIITFRDLTIFLTHLGNCCDDYPLSDFNEDGFITVGDLTGFLSLLGYTY